MCVCVCNLDICASAAMLMCGRVLVHECVHVSLFSNKDKSTLNKSTSHYAEALIYHCSNVSCIRHSLPSYFTVSPSSFLSLIKTTTRSIFRCNCAHLLQNHSFHAWSSSPRIFISFLSPCSHSDTYEYCMIYSILSVSSCPHHFYLKTWYTFVPHSAATWFLSSFTDTSL